MRNQQTIFTPNGNTAQALATDTTTPASAEPISTQCYAVRLVATEDCFVAFEGEANKTGTENLSMFLPALTPEIFAVPNGAVISAVADSAGGTLYITEMTS